MADILIRGMEMPTDSPVYLTVCPSGGVYVHTYERGYGALVKSQYRVVELPEHGDLIDRDAILHEDVLHYVDTLNSSFGGSYVKFSDLVRNAPVIIPSNKEETK